MTNQQIRKLAMIMADYIMENGMNEEVMGLKKAAEFLGIPIRELKDRIETFDSNDNEQGSMSYSELQEWCNAHRQSGMVQMEVPENVAGLLKRYNDKGTVEDMRKYLLDAFATFGNTETTGTIKEADCHKVRWALIELKETIDVFNFKK